MEPYTLNRSFLKQDVIDGFKSLIWTEKYYGDSDVELVVPSTSNMIAKLPVGTFLSINDSSEVMIVETINIEDGLLKVSGISLLKWLDNRFVRASASHEDRYWYIAGYPAGHTLWHIVWNFCSGESSYLNGTIPTGIANPEKLAIPGLSLYDYDESGPDISVGVPYGPVYTALQEVAKTHEIGMQLLLVSADESSYSLGFRSYKGLDRTSGQTDNMPVRFSPHMDSFTDIKELQSIAKFKTLVYTFAPGLTPDEGEPDLRTTPGVSSLAGDEYVGFDLRAEQTFAEDVTTDMVGGSSENLLDILNSRAYDELTTNAFVQMVDGEIVPDNQFQYGIHYNLGDIIEVEGNSGVVKSARITEYIRSQSESGEKTYPTVSIIE